jgi:putative transposase
MYLWRQLTEEQRAELLEIRRRNQRPWHGPPRHKSTDKKRFHLTAACYEHAHLICARHERMDAFSNALQAALSGAGKHTFAWCVLPNHYHAVVETWNLRETARLLGQFHGRTSFEWNRQDDARGRTCFHRVSDRAIRGDRHFWAAMNYIHHNPVHHGWVGTWADWPWSSAADYLSSVGREEALRVWREYPVGDYGKTWHSPETSATDHGEEEEGTSYSG